ncbi:unnamed protein product, partial [Amoebophrya sp. A25]
SNQKTTSSSGSFGKTRRSVLTLANALALWWCQNQRVLRWSRFIEMVTDALATHNHEDERQLGGPDLATVLYTFLPILVAGRDVDARTRNKSPSKNTVAGGQRKEQEQGNEEPK